jgi:hypothetical protein
LLFIEWKSGIALKSLGLWQRRHKEHLHNEPADADSVRSVLNE